MRLIFQILLLLLLSGCTLFKYNQAETPQTVFKVIKKDSIIHNTVILYRDTTVFIEIPGDTITVVQDIDTSAIINNGWALYSDSLFISKNFAQSISWISQGKLGAKLIINDTIIERKIFNLTHIIDSLTVYSNNNPTQENEKQGKNTIWIILLIIVIISCIIVLANYIKNRLK